MLCGMSHEQRLAFVAEGLPLILRSAEGYWDAARRLKGLSREAMVIRGHAEEEAAKILILMDVVRCPKKLVASKIGSIVRWFYDHLARLIYADAVLWKPTNVAELRGYVDSHRPSHSVEGDVGEFILPNWSLFARESQLYADVMTDDAGHATWNAPNRVDMGPSLMVSPALELVQSMSALGLYSLESLEATSEIWGRTTFTEQETSADARALTRQLLDNLYADGLVPKTATDSHVSTLCNNWQMPMYDFNFSVVEVSREQLKNVQDQLLGAQIGDVW